MGRRDAPIRFFPVPVLSLISHPSSLILFFHSPIPSSPQLVPRLRDSPIPTSSLWPLVHTHLDRCVLHSKKVLFATKKLTERDEMSNNWAILPGNGKCCFLASVCKLTWKRFEPR